MEIRDANRLPRRAARRTAGIRRRPGRRQSRDLRPQAQLLEAEGIELARGFQAICRLKAPHCFDGRSIPFSGRGYRMMPRPGKRRLDFPDTTRLRGRRSPPGGAPNPALAAGFFGAREGCAGCGTRTFLRRRRGTRRLCRRRFGLSQKKCGDGAGRNHRHPRNKYEFPHIAAGWDGLRATWPRAPRPPASRSGSHRCCAAARGTTRFDPAAGC